MRYHVSLLVSLLSQLCWAQEDTSYQPVIGERAAALPYPHLPVPRGDHPHRGGGGIHQHGHSSNKELSISLMHVAEDLKKFRIDVESRLDDMFKVLEELRKEQQQLTNLMTVLAFGGGGSFRGKRSTDDYAAPVHTGYYEPQYTTTESPPYVPSPPAYAPSPPAYAPGPPAYAPGPPAYAPSPPAYAFSPPAYDSYTPKVVTHSTEKPCPMGTCNQCPMGDCSSTHRDIFDELPGTVSKRTLSGSRSLPGYSGNAMGSYSSGSSRGYSSYTNDPPSYSTARPLHYNDMPSFYQASHTAEEDIEELEYEEYVL